MHGLAQHVTRSSPALPGSDQILQHKNYVSCFNQIYLGMLPLPQTVGNEGLVGISEPKKCNVMMVVIASWVGFRIPRSPKDLCNQIIYIIKNIFNYVYIYITKYMYINICNHQLGKRLQSARTCRFIAFMKIFSHTSESLT